MNAETSSRSARPRLDGDAKARLMEEITRIEGAATTEIEARTAKLMAQIDAEHSARAATPRPLLETPAAPVQIPHNMPPEVYSCWSRLPHLPVNAASLDQQLVITASRTDPAHSAFDVLRTRLVQALADKGWTRVAITSPTAGCGKSFTAINLAITLSRYDDCRTVLMDMDMRKHGLMRYLGVKNAPAIGDYLRGLSPLENHFCRLGANALQLGDNLAIALNGRAESYAAELFHQAKTGDVLDEMEEALEPEVILFDLPPALAQDDVIAFRPHFDCVLMVVGGGITTAEEVREATRRIGEDKPILGVVLNKAEIEGQYAY